MSSHRSLEATRQNFQRKLWLAVTLSAPAWKYSRAEVAQDLTDWEPLLTQKRNCTMNLTDFKWVSAGGGWKEKDFLRRDVGCDALS